MAKHIVHFGGGKSVVRLLHRSRLEKMKKDELEERAERLGIQVIGTGADGNVLKSDLVDALASD